MFNFASHVEEGDTSTFTEFGVTWTATVYSDDVQDDPETRDEGFWPSSDPHHCAYVEPARYQDALKEALARQDGFVDGTWEYVGVVVTAEKAGVQLVDRYAVALWGIESDCGDYVATVANELLSDAKRIVHEKLADLAA